MIDYNTLHSVSEVRGTRWGNYYARYGLIGNSKPLSLPPGLYDHWS